MSTQAYADLIGQVFPHVEIRHARPITSGWDSFVLEVNDNMIFRFPMRRDVEEQLRKEIRLLPELAAALSVPLPRFEYIWPGDATHPQPFVGYRKLKGITLNEGLNIPGRPGALAAALGRLLSELHAFPQARAAGLGVPSYSAQGWWQIFRARYEELQALIRPLIPRHTWTRVAHLWEGFLDNTASTGFQPTLTHNDLFSEHIFCDPGSGNLTGVIDWGDAAIGDPAIDFAGLLNDCGNDFTSLVFTGYKGNTGSGFWQRVDFYSRIIPFSELLHAHHTNNPDLMQDGLVRLRNAFD